MQIEVIAGRELPKEGKFYVLDSLLTVFVNDHK